jgi:DMSO/TMAO reductase YedYZ heme-binding membrane subunit
MSAVDLSSFAGLSAMVLLTVNVLLGLMLSTRYSPPVRWWPYGRRRIFDVHNWTAYVALGLVFLHPIFLLLSSSAGFHVLDVLWPLNSPGQRLYNCLGAAAFYLLLFVVITSYLRKRLGFQAWKAFHYVAYATAGALFIHGIIIDPNLKKQPPDLLDGEKVLVEVCSLLVLAGSVWRVRYALRKRRRFSSAEVIW